MKRLSSALSVLAVVAALALGACSKPQGDPAVDVDLMAYLSEARALHHQANIKEEAGDLPGAAATMKRLTDAKRPRGGNAPEINEVLADAYARLADLDLRQNDLAGANDAVTEGLNHAPEPTYFRGHLLEVQGLIEEARATAFIDAGKSAEAVASREKAIKLLEEVVQIQDHVIQQSLAGHDAGK